MGVAPPPLVISSSLYIGRARFCNIGYHTTQYIYTDILLLSGGARGVVRHSIEQEIIFWVISREAFTSDNTSEKSAPPLPE